LRQNTRRSKLNLLTNVNSTYAENSPEGRKTLSDQFFGFLTRSLFRGLQNMCTPQQRERRKEIDSKTADAIAEAIGDRVKEMLYIDGLATAPAEQGRGYGGAVLDSVTKEADAQKRMTWLISSNILNTGFYNSHGFATVGTFVVGDKNPEWKEPPIIVSIMIRDAGKSASAYQMCFA